MAAGAEAGEGEAPKKGSKKLIIIVAAAVVLLLGGGGGVLLLMKKQSDAHAAAAADEEDEDGGHSKPAPKAKDGKAVPPTFLPLEQFVVNLADRDTDKFAQVAISLQIDDPKVADQLKAYLPAVRSTILMILTRKSSKELLSEEGKQKLKEEIRREVVRPLGIEIDPPEEEAHEEDPPPKKKKKKKKPEVHNPVEQVHFSNFIIQ
jgi:flagellar FliL protein